MKQLNVKVKHCDVVFQINLYFKKVDLNIIVTTPCMLEPYSVPLLP